MYTMKCTAQQTHAIQGTILYSAMHYTHMLYTNLVFKVFCSTMIFTVYCIATYNLIYTAHYTHALQCTAVQYPAIQCIAQHTYAKQCNVLHNNTLKCTAHCTHVVQCTAFHIYTQ